MTAIKRELTFDWQMERSKVVPGNITLKACDGVASTTNSVEELHNGLQALFVCYHPTLQTFHIIIIIIIYFNNRTQCTVRNIRK